MIASLTAVLGGLVIGLALRQRSPSFAWLWRGHLVLLDLPVGLLAGWLTPLQVDALLAMAALLVAELLSVLVWRRVLSGPAGLATAPLMNTGYWSMPVAAALGGLPVVVLFDQLLSPARGALATWLLRRSAPQRPPRASALTDYLGPMGASAGLALQLLDRQPPEVSASLLHVLALVLAGAGFVLLALAWPRERVGLSGRLLAGMSLRPALAGLLLAGLLLAGSSVPAGAWVLAGSAGWFSYLALCRLYGYSSAWAARVLLAGVCVGTLLLPALAALT